MERLENAQESLQKEMRDVVQVGAVRAAKFESMQTLHEKELGRLEAEKRHAEALAARAAEELQAATQDGVRLRALLQGKDSEVEQTEHRIRAAESDRDRLIAKVRKMEETLAQATISAKRGAELRVAAVEAKEKEAVAKLDGLRAELEARTKQVSAMEKRAGDGACRRPSRFDWA